MSGDLLALGAIGALVLGGAARTRGSRAAVWLHGTKACAQVERGGWVRPSERDQVAPSLEDAVKRRSAMLAELEVAGLEQDEIDERIYRLDLAWRQDVLVPMRGFTYATIDPFTASAYAGVSRPAEGLGCVYEVAVTPGALVLPDEDWLGCFTPEALGDESCDTYNERPRMIAGFRQWLDRLRVVLPDGFESWYNEWADQAAEDVQDPPFETVALRAPLGRSVISALLGSAAGRRWLQEGAQRYATKIAHQGPMRVVGARPLTKQRPQEVDPVWRWQTKGSPNVATKAGYHRTAVAKTGASVPLRHLLKHHGDLVKGRVLDFGTGRGRDCKALGKRKGVIVSCYDPHHPDPRVRKLPTGTFDLVLANYVVNVLPPAERRKVVKQMGSKVKKGGVLVLAARGCGDRQGVQSARSWTSSGDGYAQFADDGDMSRFQRFYASGALKSEACDILGPSFFPLQITSMPSGTALVAFKRSR